MDISMFGGKSVPTSEIKTETGVVNGLEAPDTVSNEHGFDRKTINFDNFKDFRGTKLKHQHTEQEERARSAPKPKRKRKQ